MLPRKRALPPPRAPPRCAAPARQQRKRTVRGGSAPLAAVARNLQAAFLARLHPANTDSRRQAGERADSVKKCLCALTLVAAVAQPAHAVEVTANMGFMSSYVFRGIFQAHSVAMGGVDLKQGGLYAGTWAADVGQGLEVDLYGGYNGRTGDFSYGAGATGYYYTDDFDDTYQEINLSAGYRVFSISAAFGRYDNFSGTIGPGNARANRKLGYSFISPRLDYQGFYGLVGIFGNDFNGEYYEAGYASTFAPIGLDYRFAVIHGTKDLLGDTDGDGRPDDDTRFVISVSKTFRLTP